jgi:hypothetical protein
MAAPLVVTLGGITFNNDAADTNGAYWYCGEIDGWDSPAMRISQLEPTGYHGVVIGEMLYGPRALVLGGPSGSAGEGSCVLGTVSAANYWASYYRLMAATQTVPLLGARPATIALAVAEPTPKQANVLRAGPVRIREFRGAIGFNFEVPLIAADPRKHALTASTLAGAAGSAVNGGIVEVWPTLTVVGPGSADVIVTNTTTGKLVRIPVTLSGGQTLVVDFEQATATVNGTPVAVHSSTRWWTLPPGTSTITYSGGGTAVLSWRNGWV